MSEEEKKTQAKPARVWTDDQTTRMRSDKFFDLYANNTGVGFTNWDMTLIFGQIVGEIGDKLIVEERAKVTMSLQHAKAFVQIISTAFADFESKVGEIQQITLKTVPPESK